MRDIQTALYLYCSILATFDVFFRVRGNGKLNQSSCNLAVIMITIGNACSWYMAACVCCLNYGPIIDLTLDSKRGWHCPSISLTLLYRHIYYINLRRP